MRNGWVPSPAAVAASNASADAYAATFAAAGGADRYFAERMRNVEPMGAGAATATATAIAADAPAAPLKCYGATSGMSRAERFGCYNQPAAAKRQFSTYRCCCCNTDFKLDTTDDPDPRPSPLGDRCDACRAAEKPRPLDGKSLTEILGGGTCRFCNGSHWALDCPSAAGNYVMEVPTVDGQPVVIPVGAAAAAAAAAAAPSSAVAQQEQD